MMHCVIYSVTPSFMKSMTSHRPAQQFVVASLAYWGAVLVFLGTSAALSGCFRPLPGAGEGDLCALPAYMQRTLMAGPYRHLSRCEDLSLAPLPTAGTAVDPVAFRLLPNEVVQITSADAQLFNALSNGWLDQSSSLQIELAEGAQLAVEPGVRDTATANQTLVLSATLPEGSTHYAELLANPADLRGLLAASRWVIPETVVWRQFDGSVPTDFSPIAVPRAANIPALSHLEFRPALGEVTPAAVLELSRQFCTVRLHGVENSALPAALTETTDLEPQCGIVATNSESRVVRDVSVMIHSTAISTGGYYSCMIDSDGSVLCWGSNDSGQTLVPPMLGRAHIISGGGFHTCAVQFDGEPRCWGDNTFGQSRIPPNLGHVQTISAGDHHTCSIQLDGNSTCWGKNDFSQATVPPALGPISAISAGGFHTCAIQQDGLATCWGDNSAGQLLVPSDLGPVQSISAGFKHTCAIRTDGQASCWGINANGEISVPSDLGSIQSVSAGYQHTCAVKTNGSVVCWGSNSFSQLRIPSDLGPVRSISSSTFHTCAIHQDGQPVCWGNNNQGQTNAPNRPVFNPENPQER